MQTDYLLWVDNTFHIKVNAENPKEALRGTISYFKFDNKVELSFCCTQCKKVMPDTTENWCSECWQKDIDEA